MKRKMVAFFVLLFLLNNLSAQLNPELIDIPMRDGKTLSAHRYLPDDDGTYPVILIQTPYNKNLFQLGLPLGIGQDIEDSNYAFVVLDWRCFYGSLPACTPNPNRGEDGYDAVEWIAEQNWCNGRVGAWGPSALGNVQFQTAQEEPPHLVCAVPVVASPQTTYHQYYPGGAIRTEYLETLSILFGNSGFNAVINNPYYNLIWQFAESSTMYPGEIAVPMFMIAGWYDHNTFDNFVMFDTLRTSSDPAVRDLHKFLIGPWVHGGTGPAIVGSPNQGQLSYPEAAFQNNILALEFFDFYLRDIDNSWEDRPPYTYFQMGDNSWQQTDSWPPAEVEKQTLYLHVDQSIQQTPPTTPEAALPFEYDPEDPSPTVGGKTLSLGLDQGPYDQASLVESRFDAVVFSTAVLADPLTIKGTIRVQLSISSDRPDTDITLRLTDVYPDGRSMLLGEAVQRLRFLNGFREEDEEFLNPGQIYSLDLEFDPLAITFLPGHQLRLIVSSSNYPRYHRNMNTEEEMYPNGNIDTLVNPVVATNVIHLDPDFPSVIELPVEGPVSSAGTVFAEKATLNLFPNPTSDPVYFKPLKSGGTISVYDSRGQIVLRKRLEAGDASVQLGKLPAGVYWLRLREGMVFRTGKVVVK